MKRYIRSFTQINSVVFCRDFEKSLEAVLPKRAEIRINFQGTLISVYNLPSTMTEDRFRDVVVNVLEGLGYALYDDFEMMDFKAVDDQDRYVGITLGLHHEGEIPKDDEYFISIEYGKGRASAQDWY